MALVNVYLTFEGNCKEAFDFYKSVFGGEFGYVGRYGDMPPGEGKELPAEDKDKIMHVSLPISKETMLMGSDSGGEWAGKTIVGDNFSISVSADSREQADKIFNALAKGGRVTMPMADMFWGDYFGMCTDKFDINWMMSYNDKAQK